MEGKQKMNTEVTNKTRHVAGRSIPIFTIAALLLLTLKLTAYPTISWWWVFGVWLFPLIIGMAALGIILCFGVVLLMIGISLALFKK